MKRHSLVMSILTATLFSVHASAATQQCAVASDYTPTFCQDFRTAVQGCSPLGPIPMDKIYDLMIATYGSLQTACQANAIQYGSSARDCEMQWNCYWNGGTDANGQLCSTTGVACASLSL